jgi:hypothetical protein
VVRRAAALVGLAAALVALAFPAFASALIKIDSAEDEPKSAAGAVCETAAGKCTLRAAIEATNAGSSFQVIEFDIAVFNGSPGSEVHLNSPLEPLNKPMTITGHPSFGAFQSPTAAIVAPAGAAGLVVESNNVTIEEIAFNGGKYGIQVAPGETGFTARGNWFGLKLDATAATIGTAGILLGPGADEATIGGTEEGERNVFAHAEVGVQIEGASKTKVLGDYIGVSPAGTDVAGLAEGVRIADALGSPAEENEVGGTLTSGQMATNVCDGPCNAIATENGNGVSLSDPNAGMAASGPTTISGNYLGLQPSGVGAVGNSVYAVLAAPATAGCDEGPGDVTVGGTDPAARNYIAGGAFGIAAESAENFKVLGNAIGIAPGGTAVESPEHAAIELCNESITEPSLVAGNRMVLGPDALGIESSYGRAEIIGNSIEGSYKGILLNEESEGHGDLVAGNTITEPDTVGIEVENDSNVVAGNAITKAGRSGIVIDTDADHNRIGGDGTGEANTIVETIGPEEEDGAITIFGRETGRNEIAANTGFANPGAFIKLLPHGGAERPNGGIQPPVLGVVRQSSAAGTADPGATVRIFSKASAEPGELGALLAKVVADGSGAWTATYATQPVGTLVAATQTSSAGTAEAGTSTVGAPTAASADPAKPEEPGGGGGQPPATNPTPVPIPPPPAPKAPKVKFTAGPKKSSTSTTAKFRFKAEPAAGAKFECKLDGAKWAKCSSPKTYKRLKVGKHTFRVRAVSGRLTGAVQKFQFTVKP